MHYPYGVALVDLLLLLVTALGLGAAVVEHLRRAHDLCRCEDWCNNSSNNSGNSGDGNDSTMESPSNSSNITTTSSRPKKMKSQKSFAQMTGEMHSKQMFVKSMTFICVLATLIRHAEQIYLTMTNFHLTFSRSGCETMVQIFLALSTVTKFSLYSVFVARIDMSFKNTVHAYSDRTIRSCYSLLLIIFVTVMIWGPFSVDSEVTRYNYARNGERVKSDSSRRLQRCFAMIDPILASFVTILDIVIIAVLVTMFVRPLHKMYANRASVVNNYMVASDTPSKDSIDQLTPQQIRRLELDLLPIKYTLLSMVSVITTCLAVIAGAFGYGTGFTVDNFMNTACLLLMSQHWAPEYWFLCGPTLKSLYTLNCVSKGTNESIILMAAYFSYLRERQLIEEVSIAHRVLSSRSNLEIGSSAGSLNEDNYQVV